MSDSNPAADASLPKNDQDKAGPSWLVRPAPGPDLPHARDKAGAQKGMAIALVGGGLFWGAVAAAAVYVLRR